MGRLSDALPDALLIDINNSYPVLRALERNHSHCRSAHISCADAEYLLFEIHILSFMRLAVMLYCFTLKNSIYHFTNLSTPSATFTLGAYPRSWTSHQIRPSWQALPRLQGHIVSSLPLFPSFSMAFIKSMSER